MGLALFDLDNTLIGGDSDYLWGQYLAENGIVDAVTHAEANQQFYDDYKNGSLDIDEFLRFQLAPLAAHSLADLKRWREAFLEEKIEPVLLPKATELIEQHRHAGDRLLIITATNRFITEPIAMRLGIHSLIATEAEFDGECYTGRVQGIPSFSTGKVSRLQAWLQQHALDLEDSWFYSDSHNDLPLLRQVSHPVAVDPDPTLLDLATRQHWPVISLR